MARTARLAAMSATLAAVLVLLLAQEHAAEGSRQPQPAGELSVRGRVAAAAPQDVARRKKHKNPYSAPVGMFIQVCVWGALQT
jgi:hypothetical protein